MTDDTRIPETWMIITSAVTSVVGTCAIFGPQRGFIQEAAYWTPQNVVLSLLLLGLIGASCASLPSVRRSRFFLGLIPGVLVNVLVVGGWHSGVQGLYMGGNDYFRVGLIAANIAIASLLIMSKVPMKRAG